MSSEPLKFPVRTVIAAVLMLLVGLIAVVGMFSDPSNDDPWWSILLNIIELVALVGGSLAFLVKRNEKTFGYLGLGFWLALIAEVLTWVFDRNRLMSEMAGDDSAKLEVFLEVVVTIAVYVVVYLVGFTKGAVRRFEAWWKQEHPDPAPELKSEEE